MFLGTGERPLFMTKKFAFNQVLGQCRTINFDERIIFALTQRVYGSRQEFFTCTRFTENQYCGIGFGYLADLLEYFLVGVADGNNIVDAVFTLNILLQDDVFLLQPGAQFFNAFIGGFQLFASQVAFGKIAPNDHEEQLPIIDHF